MASRTRQRLGEHEGLVVETFAAAFQLHVPEPEASYVLCGYTLVIVDECSQLGQADFERILRLWGMADRVPALVFLGEKYQLPGVDPQRPWESAAWKSCQTMELVKIHRSCAPAFLETLALLRSSMPTKAQLDHMICRGRKAWSGNAPSAEDMARLLREYPQATHVAATRRGVAEVNRLALQALGCRARGSPAWHVRGQPRQLRCRAFACRSLSESAHPHGLAIVSDAKCAQGRRFFERHGLHCPQSQH